MKTELIIGRNYQFGTGRCVGKLIKQEGYFSYFYVRGEHIFTTESGLVKFKTIFAENAFALVEDQPETEEQLHEATKKEVLAYLKTGKAITKLEIIDKFRYINGGDLIFNLRKEGYNIETTMITNGKKRFASYKLIENGN